MVTEIALVILGVVAVCFLFIRWRAARRARMNALPPLFFPLSKDPTRSIPSWRELNQQVDARTPAAPAVPVPPPMYPAPIHAMRPSPNGVGAANGTANGTANGAAAANGNGQGNGGSAWPPIPAPLRVVRDFDMSQPAPDETVRFRRPSDEPVQLLPGRLEVLAGDPHHHEIRFVRVPGRPAELILGREPGDSAQHVALRSSTVSRQHARFAFVDGRWVIMNLSQTNPVVINGEELSARDGSHDLADGDRLELGEVVLRFHAH